MVRGPGAIPRIKGREGWEGKSLGEKLPEKLSGKRKVHFEVGGGEEKAKVRRTEKVEGRKRPAPSLGDGRYSLGKTGLLH